MVALFARDVVESQSRALNIGRSLPISFSGRLENKFGASSQSRDKEGLIVTAIVVLKSATVLERERDGYDNRG
jgi:hypothetical protein